MSVKEFESQLLCMGYNEEEIDRIKEVAVEVANSLAQVLHEILERFVELLSSCFEDIKNKLTDLAEWFETLNRERPGKKIYIPYNPPTGKEWYNQYYKDTIRDTRSDMRYFTIYKSGGRS